LIDSNVENSKNRQIGHITHFTHQPSHRLGAIWNRDWRPGAGNQNCTKIFHGGTYHVLMCNGD